MSLNDREVAEGQPAPKQVIKSANSQKKSCLALCNQDQIIILQGSLLSNDYHTFMSSLKTGV